MFMYKGSMNSSGESQVKRKYLRLRKVIDKDDGVIFCPFSLSVVVTSASVVSGLLL